MDGEGVFYKCPKTPVLLNDKTGVNGRSVLPRVAVSGKVKRFPDYRNANLRFNINNIPGVLEKSENLTDINPQEIPYASSNNWWTKIKDRVPLFFGGVFTLVTSFSLLRWLSAFKFIRWIAYCLPLGGAFLWWRLRYEKKRPPKSRSTGSVTRSQAQARVQPPPKTSSVTAITPSAPTFSDSKPAIAHRLY